VIAAAWTAATAFLRSPFGRYLMIGLACLAAVLLLRHHWISAGVSQEKAAEAHRLASAIKKVAKREVTATAITDKAKTGLATERVRIQTVTRTLIKEVPVYVTMIAASSLLGSCASTTPPHQEMRQAFPPPPVDLSTPLPVFSSLPSAPPSSATTASPTTGAPRR
jgi:hypothetical protein